MWLLELAVMVIPAVIDEIKFCLPFTWEQVHLDASFHFPIMLFFETHTHTYRNRNLGSYTPGPFVKGLWASIKCPMDIWLLCQAWDFNQRPTDHRYTAGGNFFWGFSKAPPCGYSKDLPLNKKMDRVLGGKRVQTCMASHIGVINHRTPAAEWDGESDSPYQWGSYWSSSHFSAIYLKKLGFHITLYISVYSMGHRTGWSSFKCRRRGGDAQLHTTLLNNSKLRIFLFNGTPVICTPCVSKSPPHFSREVGPFSWPPLFIQLGLLTAGPAATNPIPESQLDLSLKICMLRSEE